MANLHKYNQELRELEERLKQEQSSSILNKSNLNLSYVRRN